MLDAYGDIAGAENIEHLRQLAGRLKGMKIVHVNSTRVGGGVAEILRKLVPLSSELGIDTQWEVITGSEAFYRCTKSIHNALQGRPTGIPAPLLKLYEETCAANAARLCPLLREADIVFIHDPQPAALLSHCAERKGRWIWRCHIDVSRPYRPVWNYFRKIVSGYDASIFSLAAFAQRLPHPTYLVAPSIDPLSDKNVDLPDKEIDEVRKRFGLDPERLLLVQVSRFDRFKDPLGVIQAYRLAKGFAPALQLVLAGGGASDDPEGEAVLQEVKEAAGGDPDIHVLLLPPDDRTINALQRAANIVIQKSLREGFGLTVTEALWKGKPVYRRQHGRHPFAGRGSPYRLPGEQSGGRRAARPLLAAQSGQSAGDVSDGNGVRSREFPDNPPTARVSGGRRRADSQGRGAHRAQVNRPVSMTGKTAHSMIVLTEHCPGCTYNRTQQITRHLRRHPFGPLPARAGRREKSANSCAAGSSINCPVPPKRQLRHGGELRKGMLGELNLENNLPPTNDSLQLWALPLSSFF